MGREREPSRTARFEQAVLPHLDAAYNLARWLVRNAQDAEDMVQEACLRAFTFFDSFHGEGGRAWLLAIVRNTCYTWLRKNRAQELLTVFDEQLHSPGTDAMNPEILLMREGDRQLVQRALNQLPVEYREVLVLREIEGMSYKQISGITDVPMGTVMSRLARARRRVQQSLALLVDQEPQP